MSDSRGSRNLGHSRESGSARAPPGRDPRHAHGHGEDTSGAAQPVAGSSTTLTPRNVDSTPSTSSNLPQHVEEHQNVLEEIYEEESCGSYDSDASVDGPPAPLVLGNPGCGDQIIVGPISEYKDPPKGPDLRRVVEDEEWTEVTRRHRRRQLQYPGDGWHNTPEHGPPASNDDINTQQELQITPSTQNQALLGLQNLQRCAHLQQTIANELEQRRALLQTQEIVRRCVVNQIPANEVRLRPQSPTPSTNGRAQLQELRRSSSLSRVAVLDHLIQNDRQTFFSLYSQPTEAAEAISDPPVVMQGQERRMRVYWFPVTYTQTSINGRIEPTGRRSSNACTIICVLVASRMNDPNYHLKVCHSPRILDRAIAVSYAKTIFDGNSIHWDMLRQGKLRHMNLTVPEALAAAWPHSRNIVEWFFVQRELEPDGSLCNALYDQVTSAIRRWISPFSIKPRPVNHELFMVIIADARSVLIVFHRDKRMLSIFDSHSHLHAGAVISLVDLENLHDMCSWYEESCHTMYGRGPHCFEMSCLYETSPPGRAPPMRPRPFIRNRQPTGSMGDGGRDNLQNRSNSGPGISGNPPRQPLEASTRSRSGDPTSAGRANAQSRNNCASTPSRPAPPVPSSSRQVTTSFQLEDHVTSSRNRHKCIHNGPATNQTIRRPVRNQGPFCCREADRTTRLCSVHGSQVVEAPNMLPAFAKQPASRSPPRCQNQGSGMVARQTTPATRTVVASPRTLGARSVSFAAIRLQPSSRNLALARSCHHLAIERRGTGPNVQPQKAPVSRSEPRARIVPAPPPVTDSEWTVVQRRPRRGANSRQQQVTSTTTNTTATRNAQSHQNHRKVTSLTTNNTATRNAQSQQKHRQVTSATASNTAARNAQSQQNHRQVTSSTANTTATRNAQSQQNHRQVTSATAITTANRNTQPQQVHRRREQPDRHAVHAADNGRAVHSNPPKRTKRK